MTDIINRFLQKRKWSIYMALIIWGSSGFMAQPTLASIVYHLGIIPFMLLLLLFIAHHEVKPKEIEHVAEDFSSPNSPYWRRATSWLRSQRGRSINHPSR